MLILAYLIGPPYNESFITSNGQEILFLLWVVSLNLSSQATQTQTMLDAQIQGNPPQDMCLPWDVVPSLGVQNINL